MDTAKFITYFKNKINREINNIKDSSVGELKGLRLAKNLLQESAKNIENDDTEI